MRRYVERIIILVLRFVRNRAERATGVRYGYCSQLILISTGTTSVPLRVNYAQRFTKKSCVTLRVVKEGKQWNV